MDAKTTGRFLAELRKEKGYTQKELGDKLMVTDKAISRWETGKGLPDTALLKPLSEILGVSESAQRAYDVYPHGGRRHIGAAQRGQRCNFHF